MNKVILIGNLTRDPESRQTATGVSYCRFGIAVNRRFANANGERETDFFNIIAWRQLADTCAKNLSKGRKVCVVGSININNYESNGEKRTSVDITADEVEFLSPRAPEGEGTPYTGTATQSMNRKQSIKTSAPIEDEEDLPF